MRLTMPPHIDPLHPIATQEYAIYTPPIDELIETIGNWINRKESGGYAYSPPRYGKSRAVKWFVHNALEDRFNTFVPLVIWIRRHDMQVTEGDFWQEILLASGLIFAELKVLKSKTKFREEALNRMISIAEAAKSNYIVLVIDEAHDMTLKEWRWLLGLQNHLDKKGYRFSVISVGTQQLSYQHNFLAKTGNGQIAARFMVSSCRFYGLRDKEELRYVLNGYDIESEWPDKSGVSYLKYFSPENYRRGFRLVNYTDLLWDVFFDLIPKDDKKLARSFLESGIPMKHVALVVEEILWLLAEGGDWDEVISKSSLNEILTATDFVPHFKAICALA